MVPRPDRPAQSPQRAWLYCLRDTGNRAVYVGITDTPLRRLRQHSSQKPWWRLVDRVGLWQFEDRASALAAEATLIHYFRPPFNVQCDARRVGTPTSEPVADYDLHVSEVV